MFKKRSYIPQPLWRVIPHGLSETPIGWIEGKKVRSMVCPYDPTNDIKTAGPELRLKLASGEIVTTSKWTTKGTYA